MRADLLADERRARLRSRALQVAAGMTMLAASATVLRNLAPRWPEDAAAPIGRPAAATPAPDASAARPATSALKTRPLSAWLADVARDAGRALVISPELRGDLTASESSALDWRERLDAYSRVFGFDFAIGDGLIEVSRMAAAAREGRPGVRAAEKVADTSAVAAAEVAASPAPAAQTAQGAEKAASPVPPPEPPPQTRVVRLSYASAKETASAISKAGDALDVSVTADAATNALVLSGPTAGISRVRSVIDDLDLPRRRILLDARIVEITRSARFDLGVEWKLTGTTIGGDAKFPPQLSDAGSAALVIATHGAAALDARISALEADGKLRVVSRPSVVMLEGSPATIESVRILRIRLPSQGTVVGDEVVSGGSGRATEDIPVGVRLEVTPAIRGHGRVLLRIKAKSSNLGAPLPPDDIPEELSRMVDAEVLVAGGETAVLGGLTREAATRSGAGVPGLRRVPTLGALFGKKSDATQEEELVVLVTPRVLD